MRSRLARAIRDARLAAGLTQEQLSSPAASQQQQPQQRERATHRHWVVLAGLTSLSLQPFEVLPWQATQYSHSFSFVVPLQSSS
jgi:hypothetical protein